MLPTEAINVNHAVPRTPSGTDLEFAAPTQRRLASWGSQAVSPALFPSQAHATGRPLCSRPRHVHDDAYAAVPRWKLSRMTAIWCDR
ncbi:hypothetical protein BV25DRAFT_307809 [Artomyces pyxidatus]|uniref:Uncharacterized protein n=1 Tax=Artomyces pyxidatus TaxID=48021 RepID=A0ACB8T8H2_9AGAM|nr:hypothetical protein BV25DRAFT_307809 [Artomyces pyxidatus]